MMTVRQIYELAIKLGIENDLRGAATVRRRLKRQREQYEKLPTEQKKEFDIESLANPFSDTRMFAADPNKPVKRILAGIDIKTAEVLLAQQIAQTRPIDLILSHHPIGSALAGLHEVMELQAEVLAQYGVPITIAESLVKIRLAEVSRSVSSVNHNRELDAARLLGFDMMCTHTATDNMVATYLERLLRRERKNLEYVGDVIRLLKKIPEYALAMKQKAGPMLFTGREDRFAGKIAVTEITGGTEGSKDMYERLAQAGIGTIIGMHLHEDYKKEAEKHHLNVIIAGHMSSDSVGMNLFLDEIEQRGVEVIPCSGLIRVQRFKGKKRAARKKKRQRK
ncbi:MAG: NGG1p interacting factor NIF3 [Patescibacteria group bacterium]